MKAEEVLGMPITKLLSINKSELEEFLLQLNSNKNLLNHLATIHASMLFSLAEISSGYFLAKHFDEVAPYTLPILRNSSVKYKSSAIGTIYSKARLKGISKTEIINALKSKRKALFTIEVKLFNEESKLVVQSDFEWFVTLKTEKASA